MKKITQMILSIAIIALLVGCTTPIQTPKDDEGKAPKTIETVKFSINEEIVAKQFNSKDEFNSFIQSKQGTGASYGGMMSFARSDMSSVAMPESAPMATKSMGADLDYSQTNNQVASVDEGDLIKTDGEYIYTISANTVFVIKAYPGEDAKIVSTIELKNTPLGLYIENDNLAVYGSFYDIEYFTKMSIRPRGGMTYFDIYDLSDKSNPELAKEYKFEGNYFQSRLVDGYVYFVTDSYLESRRIDPMPMMFIGEEKKQMSLSDLYYFPIPYNYPQIETINAIPLDDVDNKVTSKAVIVEGGQNMYMSEDNMYLVYTEYINEWEIREDITKDIIMARLNEDDKRLIDKINSADEDLLSSSEKKNKVMQIINEYINFLSYEQQKVVNEKIDSELKKELNKYDYFEYTIINKISTSKDSIKIVANGKVPGHVLNQFSMDEDNGILRIATTVQMRENDNSFRESNSETSASSNDGDSSIEAPVSKMSFMPRFEQRTTNSIYALDEDLKILGQLDGLAKGEQIYSTRFIEDRLYMVTFRQVDPFFVIDLSDPTDIKELGQLKIPGFSRYLHPYDENVIIGIGRDATEMGMQQGMKISLFDVSDVENPKEVAKYVSKEDSAQTTAEWEHKAFLFSKEKALLVIPAYSYDYKTNKQLYNGAMVFKITVNDIELRGVIDHTIGGEYWYSPTVERSLYINELLYTKSPQLLRINELDDLDSVKKIELKSKGTSTIPIY